MKEISGDILALAEQGRFDVIIHGCNCFCSMAGGIARSIRMAYPDAAKADAETEKGDKGKLGKYSQVTIEGEQGPFVLVNAYTQYEPGMAVDYDAIRQVFSLIRSDFSGQRIAYPMVGAGIAGGDWMRISVIIDTELAGEDHTLVRYSPTWSRG